MALVSVVRESIVLPCAAKLCPRRTLNSWSGNRPFVINGSEQDVQKRTRQLSAVLQLTVLSEVTWNNRLHVPEMTKVVLGAM